MIAFVASIIGRIHNAIAANQKIGAHGRHAAFDRRMMVMISMSFFNHIIIPTVQTLLRLVPSCDMSGLMV